MPTKKTMFFISSLPPRGRRLGEFLGGYWSVENLLHWPPDVIFGEHDGRMPPLRTVVVEGHPGRRRGGVAERYQAAFQRWPWVDSGGRFGGGTAPITAQNKSEL